MLGIFFEKCTKPTPATDKKISLWILINLREAVVTIVIDNT
jgi:hypothetical protein